MGISNNQEESIAKPHYSLVTGFKQYADWE